MSEKQNNGNAVTSRDRTNVKCKIPLVDLALSCKAKLRTAILPWLLLQNAILLCHPKYFVFLRGISFRFRMQIRSLHTALEYELDSIGAHLTMAF
jgi:hypothetical protein